MDASHRKTNINFHIAPQLISLGLNHSLCISRGYTSPFKHKNKTGNYNDSVKSNLNVLSWGKVDFNCLGQGVDISVSETPRIISFFSGKNVTHVSCGDYHSAVLVVSSATEQIVGGTLFTFGLGNGGRLGYYKDDNVNTNADVLCDFDNPSWFSPVPHPVGVSIGLKNNILTVSCGADHTLVTTVDGYLYSWGVGAFGVLGTGDTKNQYTPVKVIFSNEYDVFIIKCSAGSRHSAALDSNGNVWSWGYGANGRLGLGTTKSYYSPKMIKVFDGYEIIQISCGDTHTACIDRFGSVYTWGSSKNGKLGHGKYVYDVFAPKIVQKLLGIHMTQVSCGSGSTISLSSRGTVYHWGYIIGNNFSNVLSSNFIYIPQELETLDPKNLFITSGPYSCAVVDSYGDLLTWGIGSSYRLGHGDTTDYALPKIVPELRNKMYFDNITLSNQEVINDVSDPMTCKNPYDERRIQQISVGDAHGVFITHNGNVYAWGINNGIGYNESMEDLENFAEPRLLTHFSSKIKRISCGSNHTLAITVNGLLFSWGCNDSGQLGLGDLRSRTIPEHVNSIENALNVFAGIDNSCCITSPCKDELVGDECGDLWVFGSSCSGKLGLGESMSPSIINPRRIINVSGVYKVALGPAHTIILTQDGTIYSCGGGAYGRLGLGNIKNTSLFSQVQSGIKFMDLAVGTTHSLAISVDHDLYGWGNETYLCIKGVGNVLSPTLISSLPSPSGVAKVCAVTAAGGHSLVLTLDGCIIAWGDNKFGQLGVKISNKSDDNFIDVPSIVDISVVTTSITTSRYYTACSTSRGDTFSWGLSSDNRLGIGVTKSKIIYKPTPISMVAVVGDMIDKFDDRLYNDTDTYSSMVNAFLGELHFYSNDNAINWKNLQILLKNEERATSESSLKAFEDDLINSLMKHVNFIFMMDENHNQMKALQFKLHAIIRGFITNNVNLKKSKTISNDPLFKFKSKLIQIQRFIEVIFLQPAYFVRLSLFCDEIDTVASMISAVYNNLENNRIHYQFISCLLSILREEIKLFFNPMTPLNASYSPFSRILRAYSSKRHITSLNANLFFSNESESIVSHLALYKEKILIPQDCMDNDDDKLNTGIIGFGNFIIHFGTLLPKFVVSDSIKLLFSTMYKTVKEKIPAELASNNVPLADVAVYPLVPIYVYALIQPYFKSPNLVAEQCGYPPIDDAMILHNFNVISQYLDYIVNPELTMPKMSIFIKDATERLYRNLSKLFLNHVKSLLTYDSDFNIDLTMEIFKSHFDLNRINVVIPSHLIAKFVNISSKNESFLNLSSHDPLIRIIHAMNGYNTSENIFDDATLEYMKSINHLTKVKIEHRFMIFYKNMSFCTFSNTFLPQQLAYRQYTHSDNSSKHISLIVRYVPYCEYDPAKVIQDALISLKDINITCGGYDALCNELESQSQYYTNLNKPYYNLAMVARNSINVIRKLESSKTSSIDLVKLMLEKVIQRIRHRAYLLHIYNHQSEIEDFRKRYEHIIAYNCDYLKKCIVCAATGYIEPRISQAAGETAVSLFSSKSKHNIVLSTDAITYNCEDLIKMNVLFPNSAFDNDLHSHTKMTFTADYNTFCSIKLCYHKNLGDKMHKIQVETLQSFMEMPNDSLLEIFVSDEHPMGIFTINTIFLSNTFMQLLSSY